MTQLVDFTLRLGRPEDADRLVAFDDVARLDRRRIDLIRRKLQDGACWVAECDARLLGYACLGASFGYDFLELIYVDATRRRRGVGRARTTNTNVIHVDQRVRRNAGHARAAFLRTERRRSQPRSR